MNPEPEAYPMKLLIILALLALIAMISRAHGMPPAEAERLADAIFHCEGGDRAKVPYGILSVKVSGKEEARRVCLNTIKNNFKRWQAAGAQGSYLEFLARRYAPIGASNDPKALNQNWLRNVRAHLEKNV